jgi:hypothetical protein
VEIRSAQKSLIPIGLFLLNLFLAGGLFIAFYILPVPSLLPCTHSLAKTILLALGMTLVLNVLAAVFWRKLWIKRSRLSFLVLVGLCLLTLWLGSYPYSPLGFSNGNYPILRGFLITRQGRVNEPVDSGDIILLPVGSPAAITVLSDLTNLSCQWNSLNGGAWDDPGSCDTAYLAPAADYDILTVRIEPGCKLPPIRAQIKISILP